MKTLILFIILTTTIQPVLSRETDAHKFWNGNGGKIVLIGKYQDSQENIMTGVNPVSI